MSESPSIHVELFAEKPSIGFGVGDAPEVRISVTCLSDRPITIFTWDTILHPRLSLGRKNFTCCDISATPSVSIDMSNDRKLKRCAFRAVLGDSDEKYFLTLYPGVPFELRQVFNNLTSTGSSRNFIMAGHRYEVNVADIAEIKWWRYGTKNEVLAPPGSHAGLFTDRPSTSIHLTAGSPVEFEFVDGEAV